MISQGRLETVWQHALAAYERGSYQQAVRLLLQLLQWQPRNAAAYLELARCYTALKCPVVARRYYEKAIRYAGSDTKLMSAATQALELRVAR